MARIGKSMPGFDTDYSKPWDEAQEKKERALVIQWEREDKVVRWGHADGYAQYYVESLSPLVLRPIPIGDAWRKEPAFERGLNRQDVEHALASNKALRELFIAKKKGA